MNNMERAFTTIEEARRWASLFLKTHYREERVADWLLEHHLDMTYTGLLVHGRDPFPDDKRKPFVKDVEQHAETGIPVQHLTGWAEFYGRRFTVNADVLVPRPETEELVEGVLQLLHQTSRSNPLKIVDLGTGSGAIACTLALEAENVEVHATDISAEALQVAGQNAKNLGAEVIFHQGDFLSPVASQEFDIIVSNPPYISYVEQEELSETVSQFDPHLALFAEDEGLAAYRTIARQIKQSASSPQLIVFEIGHQQGEAVRAIMEEELPVYQVEIRTDINGKPRMIFAIAEN